MAILNITSILLMGFLIGRTGWFSKSDNYSGFFHFGIALIFFPFIFSLTSLFAGHDNIYNIYLDYSTGAINKNDKGKMFYFWVSIFQHIIGFILILCYIVLRIL